MTVQATLREGDYFRAWLPFFMCQTVVGFLAGAVAGGIAGALLAITGTEPESTSFAIITGGVGFIASLPVSYYFFRLFVSRLLIRKHAE